MTFNVKIISNRWHSEIIQVSAWYSLNKVISLYKRRIHNYVVTSERSKYFTLYYERNNIKCQLNVQKKLYDYGIQHNDQIQIVYNDNEIYHNKVSSFNENDINDNQRSLIDYDYLKSNSIYQLFSQTLKNKCTKIGFETYQRGNGVLWKALLSVKYKANDLTNVLNEYKKDFVSYGKEYLLNEFHHQIPLQKPTIGILPEKEISQNIIGFCNSIVN